jgi:acetylglutamate kinase
VVLLKLVGLNPVVVHGGGPQIESALKRLGKKGHFIQGMRVTDAETMEHGRMVLAGQVHKEIVSLINKAGGKAVGLTGKDGAIIRARKLKMVDSKDPGSSIDIGQVGDITQSIDPSVIKACRATSSRSSRRSASVTRRELQHQRRRGGRQAGRGAEGREAGDADQHAGRARQGGQAAHRPDGRQIDAMVADGTLSGGMLPKIASALDAARNGVRAVHIIDGRVPHALLLEVLSDQAYGTMIRSA